MLKKFEVSGVHMAVDDKLNRYTEKKIGRLDKYLSKHSRQTAHAKVILKEDKAKDKKHSICEVVLYLPHETITVKESTVNVYAAVDIVETKLKQQIKKYKETHENGKMRARRFRHRNA
jgi:ribosomal subunit interface protein